MHREFAITNRRIIEQYFEKINYDSQLLLDICLHDAVGQHQNNTKWPHSILGFSKYKEDTTNALIPDLYAMQNYRGMLDANLSDNLSTMKKLNRLLFIGASSGPANTELNPRIQLCRYAKTKPWIDAYISSIVNFDTETADTFTDVMHKPMSIPEQQTYRHLVVIDGNTVCWDRLPWILASQSVCWLHDTTDECWYYHFLKPWVHYIPFNLENLEETWNKVKDDNGLILKIVANANEFVQDYLSERGHGLYCLSLLEGVEVN